MSWLNAKQRIGGARVDPDVRIAIAGLIRGKQMSLHAARIEKQIAPHYHGRAEEIYYILQGRGEMTLAEETRPVGPDDVVYIAPGKVHSLKRAGEEDLVILFASSPPFSPETDRIMVQ